MYVTPQLNRVGDAREVILGQSGYGLDLDTTALVGGFEYAEEYLPDSAPNANG